MTPIYRLSPDLKEVVQQPTEKYPSGGDPFYYEKRKGFQEHVSSLPRFPARGFTEKWLGVDLKEGKNLKLVKTSDGFETYFDTEFTEERQREKYIQVAVPISESETIEKMAERLYPYPENDLYKPGDSDFEEMMFVVMKERSAFIAGASSQKEEIEDLKSQIKNILEAVARGEKLSNDLKFD